MATPLATNTQIYFSDGGLTVGNQTYVVGSLALYRDPSAWYHIVIAMDTTNATAGDRIILYINGSRITLQGSTIPQNTDFAFNSTVEHNIGARSGGFNFNGYLANIHFIDGQQLTPSSFTETDATTGQLIPKTYTGSYGTNGFNLLFADNSSNTASTLGKDTSGLGNNWTPNNFSVVSGTGVVTVPTTNAPPTVDYLVVAGGGGGGGNDPTSSRASGGGGAGGFRTANGFSVTSGAQYTVTVGAGGAGGVGGGFNPGTNGGNSVFGSITSAGGGGGAEARGGTGLNGGSGGGGGDNGGGAGLGNSPATSPSQGSNGGASGGVGIAGGGGGASTAGTTLAGGTGTASSISGSSVTYSTGGQPGQTTPATGTANTGNGGGGNFGSNTSGYSGGSGIVILRYANTYDDLIVGSGLTYTYANTGGYKIYSFTASATAAQSAGNDSLVDSPTNYGTDTGVGGEVRGNYCTINPLDQRFTDNGTISNGNLDYVQSSTGARTARGSIGVSSGKWYWEFTYLGGNVSHGIAKASSSLATYPGGDADGWSWFSGGNIYNNGGTTGAYSSSTYTTNDVIGVALDLAAGTLVYYKNGVSQGTAASGLSGTWFPAFGSSSTVVISFNTNFGQRPFAYTAPSGFKALCTQNLPAPLVTKSNTVMDVVTYTGTGASLTPTSSLGFNPDWIWIKSRSAATDHALYDVVRGAQARLESNTTDAEVTTDGGVTAFNSAGFTLGTLAQVNTSAATYVAWCWDAGTSTVSNTQGSITSQVRANATAGFSVIDFTCQTSGTGTVGHGLGVAPEFFIYKIRNSASAWTVYHKSIGNLKRLTLNTTDAQSADDSSLFNSTSPSSTLITLGGAFAGNGSSIVYAFAPVVGVSSFGSYTGNGSTEGPFVYTGFRSRWVMIKCSSASGSSSNWIIQDTARNTYNAINTILLPNLSNGDATVADYSIDFLSNGFKPRTTNSNWNLGTATYVWAAFAEAPFNYARAR
jgi:hypothetical protein